MSEAQMIITDGGMGDLIAELVAVNHNIEEAPHIKWRLFCPDYLRLFAKHVLPKSVEIYPFSDAEKFFNKKCITKSTDWSPYGHSPMHTHPVDYGFHMLCDRHMDDDESRNYLQIRTKEIDTSKFNLPDRYVCIGATAAVPCKALPGKVIDEISAYVLSVGYTPVYLGKSESKTGVPGLSVIGNDTGADKRNGIDLVDKTTILESAAILSQAAMFIGMDGGLLHLSGCTQAPIVCGFTLVDPWQVAPYRNGVQTFRFHPVEPPVGLKGRYYQSYVNVAEPGDRRFFPGWQAVLGSLTSDRFINEIRKVIG